MVAIIWGVDNGSFFVPFGVLTFWRPFARFLFYRKHISVDDKDLEGVVERLSSIDFYWHTLSVKGKGLAYCGVTLVPPCSLKAFIDSIADIPELCELKKLFKKALDKNKWVIHYGI